MNAQTTHRIQYEDRQGRFLSSETIQYFIQLGGTTFAGLVVIITALVMARVMGAL